MFITVLCLDQVLLVKYTPVLSYSTNAVGNVFGFVSVSMDLSIVYLKKRKAFGRAATHLVTTEPELLGEFEANEALIASYPERNRVHLNVQAIPERSEHWVGACRPAWPRATVTAEGLFSSPHGKLRVGPSCAAAAQSTNRHAADPLATHYCVYTPCLQTPSTWSTKATA